MMLAPFWIEETDLVRRCYLWENVRSCICKWRIRFPLTAFIQLFFPVLLCCKCVRFFEIVVSTWGFSISQSVLDKAVRKISFSELLQSRENKRSHDITNTKRNKKINIEIHWVLVRSFFTSCLCSSITYRQIEIFRESINFWVLCF